MPVLSHLCVVLGAQTTTDAVAAAASNRGHHRSRRPAAVATSGTPVLDGGVAVVLPAGHASPWGLGPVEVAAAAAHALDAGGAMVYASVDFAASEFLVARDGRGPRGRWAAQSFRPWQPPATRQWVLASPLLLPNGDGAAPPSWTVADVDGALDGNAFFADWLTTRPTLSDTSLGNPPRVPLPTSERQQR
jgi:hypothetical protein